MGGLDRRRRGGSDGEHAAGHGSDLSIKPFALTNTITIPAAWRSTKAIQPRATNHTSASVASPLRALRARRQRHRCMTRNETAMQPANAMSTAAGAPYLSTHDECAPSPQLNAS